MWNKIKKIWHWLFPLPSPCKGKCGHLASKYNPYDFISIPGYCYNCSFDLRIEAERQRVNQAREARIEEMKEAIIRAKKEM